MNRMLHNRFSHLKFYCLQLKMGLNYPLVEGNKTSNVKIDYVTFYSLQDIKGKEQKNFQAISFSILIGQLLFQDGSGLLIG